MWGANPSASAPHTDEHWLAEAPGTIVVVDPIATGTAQRADLHLQPFPGSDAALAFALLHVLVRDGLADRAFLAEHAIGFDELEPALQPCTPEWGERATGVPAATSSGRRTSTVPARRCSGSGRACSASPWAATRCARARCCPPSPATSGARAPGSSTSTAPARRGIDGDYVTAQHLAARPRPTISQMDLAERLEDPQRAQALLAWNINIAASNPQQARLRAALGREDLFTVAIDIFGTDTTDLADVVLPAASFLECDDLVLSYFDLSVSAQVKAGDPPGEALPNPEIFRRLAAAMGYTEPELFEPDRVVIEELLRQTGIGMDFAALSAVGTVPYGGEPIVQFAGGVVPTPSGRVEIASDRAEADGLPRLPFPHADPRPAGDMLRLLSPASPWLLNDSFANDAKVALRIGAPKVALHPADAAERGLAAGDQVVLANETGHLELELELSEWLPRGVALSPKGRWPKRESANANVNVLNPGTKSDMGDATAVHGVEVRVSRAV